MVSEVNNPTVACVVFKSIQKFYVIYNWRSLISSYTSGNMVAVTVLTLALFLIFIPACHGVSIQNRHEVHVYDTSFSSCFDRIMVIVWLKTYKGINIFDIYTQTKVKQQ